MSELKVLTKNRRVILVREEYEDEESDKVTTVKKRFVLTPFGSEFFNRASELLVKYFSCYHSVKEEYSNAVNEIIDSTEDPDIQNKKLALLKETFKETEKIISAILNSGESTVADDVMELVEACSASSEAVRDLHWGEVVVLLSEAVEVNMDFFSHNSDAITIIQAIQEQPSLSADKTGESSSPDLSETVTPGAKSKSTATHK